MERITLSDTEALEALLQAAGTPEVMEPNGARTANELRVDTGLSEDRLRRALNTLVFSGDWECVMVQRPTVIPGRATRVPGYRPVSR